MRSVRFLLAPPLAVICVLIVYLGADLIFLWVAYETLLSQEDLGFKEFRLRFGVGLIIAMFAYGVSRVRLFHPLHNAAYRSWLELSPWDSRLPLPLGPVYFVWQDALLISATTALAVMRWNVHTLAPLTAFAAGYALAACLSMVHSRWPLALISAVLFGVPAMIMLILNPWAIFGIGLGLLVIAHIGLRQSLRSFPWPQKDLTPRANILGPPFDRLTPEDTRGGIPRGMGLYVGIVLSWWVFAVVQYLEWMLPRHALIVSIGAAILLSFVRLMAYYGTCHPPLGLLGRIFTGHLIIPRYDYALIAPLVTVSVGVITPLLCTSWGLQPAATLCISLCLVIAAVTELGPSLRNWRLTGAHSKVLGRRQSQVNQSGPNLAWVSE